MTGSTRKGTRAAPGTTVTPTITWPIWRPRGTRFPFVTTPEQWPSTRRERPSTPRQTSGKAGSGYTGNGASNPAIGSTSTGTSTISSNNGRVSESSPRASGATHRTGKLGKIRTRPHVTLGHVPGISSDLHITAGDESDVIKRLAFESVFFTVVGPVQLVPAVLAIVASL